MSSGSTRQSRCAQLYAVRLSRSSLRRRMSLVAYAPSADVSNGAKQFRAGAAPGPRRAVSTSAPKYYTSYTTPIDGSLDGERHLGLGMRSLPL
jgi:hypothetical protein